MEVIPKKYKKYLKSKKIQKIFKSQKNRCCLVEHPDVRILMLKWNDNNNSFCCVIDVVMYCDIDVMNVVMSCEFTVAVLVM